MIFTTCGLPNSLRLCPFFLFSVLKTLGLLHSHQPERRNNLCCLTINYPVSEHWIPFTDRTLLCHQGYISGPQVLLQAGETPDHPGTTCAGFRVVEGGGKQGKENSTKDTGREKRQDGTALFRKLREKEKDSSCCHVEEKFKGSKTQSGGRPAQQHLHQARGVVGAQAAEGRGLLCGQTRAAGREGLAGEEIRKTGMRREKSRGRESRSEQQELGWVPNTCGKSGTDTRGAVRKLQVGLRPQA